MNTESTLDVRVADFCAIRVQAPIGEEWAGPGTVIRDLAKPDALDLLREGFVEAVVADG